MKQVFKADNPIQVIGTRHGEKLYETLLTREEMAVAEDMGDYYRVPADNRDLNYGAVLRHGPQRRVGEGRLQQPQHEAALGGRDGATCCSTLDIVQRALAGENESTE